MPMNEKGLCQFNRRFGCDHIDVTAKSAKDFAPDRKFDAGKLLAKDAGVTKAFAHYLNGMPGGMQETFRGVIYYSLTLKKPKPITLAWLPGYDFELTVSESGCGITLLLKGRYPTDRLSEITRRTD